MSADGMPGPEHYKSHGSKTIDNLIPYRDIPINEERLAKRNEEVFQNEIAAEKIFDSEIVGSANRIDVIF
jgi:hypothetical protein